MKSLRGDGEVLRKLGFGGLKVWGFRLKLGLNSTGKQVDSCIARPEPKKDPDPCIVRIRIVSRPTFPWHVKAFYIRKDFLV